MPAFVLDYRNFLRGASDSDDIPSAGFSPLSKGVSVFASPGLIKPGPLATSASLLSNNTDGIFGWSTWSTNLAPGITRALGGKGTATFDGLFYLLSDTGTATLAQTSTTKDYKPGISDLIRYQGNFYATSTADIALLNFDFSTIDPTYWDTTLAQAALTTTVPHPMCVFDDFLYIADGRYLHEIDGVTPTAQVLALPMDYVISDLVVFENRLYISAARYSSLSENVPAADAAIFTWPGYGETFEVFPIQDAVDTLKVFGGALLMFTNSYVGYWNGSTINTLRALTSRVYRYQVTITKDRLYFTQGTNVFCLGNPIAAKPKFFSMPHFNANTIGGIYCPRPGVMLYSAYNDNVTNQTSWGISDLDSSALTSTSFYSDKVWLGAYAKVKKVILELETFTTGSSLLVEYIDSHGTLRTLGTIDFTTHGAISYYEFKIQNEVYKPTFFIQMKLTWNGTPYKGVRRVVVATEPTELVPNK